MSVYYDCKVAVAVWNEYIFILSSNILKLLYNCCSHVIHKKKINKRETRSILTGSAASPHAIT